MEKAQDYQRRAAQCRKLMAMMRTDQQRQALEEIARAWEALARERAELAADRQEWPPQSE
jgi:chromosome segregation ATPase